MHKICISNVNNVLCMLNSGLYNDFADVALSTCVHARVTQFVDIEDETTGRGFDSHCGQLDYN